MPIRILKKDDESKKNKSKTVSKEEATNMQKDARRDYVRANKMLVGGQAKLDKNKNNKIDAEDFKILKAEKAKGRGMGLQDEKMKPGKVMKAKRGQFTKSNVSGHSRSSQGTTAKSAMGKTFQGYSKVFKTGVSAGDKTKATSTIIGVKPSAGGKGGPPKKTPKEARSAVKDFIKRRKKLAGVKSLIGKGGRIGAAAAILGLAGAGAAKVGQTIGRKIDEAKKKNKKMGGGMMMRPTNYAEGGDARKSQMAQQARRMGQRKRKPGLLGGAGKAAPRRSGVPSMPGKKEQPYMILRTSVPEGPAKRFKTTKDFEIYKDQIDGMKIKNVSNKSVGGSVTVKTKLGRNKPTKMY